MSGLRDNSFVHLSEDEEAALRDDLQDVVDAVAAALGAPATLEDRDFTLLAFCAHPDSGDDAGPGAALDAVRTRSILTRGSPEPTRRFFEDFGIATATAPLRIPADPAAGILTRLCIPVRSAGRLRGWLWLLDEGRTDPDDVTAPGLAAALDLAAEAGRLLAADDAPGTTDLPAALRAVLLGVAPQRAAATLTAALGERTPVVLVALHPAAGGLPGDWVPPAAGAVPVVLDGGEVAVLLPLPRAGDPRPAGALTAAALAGLPPGSTAGVSTPSPGCGRLAAQWQEARTAARVAAVAPGLAPVASWAELGAWRQVAELSGPDPAVSALLADPLLTETAEVWLDCAGSPQRAATRLCIHRQTLYYRLGRIAELTGLDLADGADRLLLHLGVRAARLAAAPDRLPAATHDGDLGSGH